MFNKISGCNRTTCGRDNLDIYHLIGPRSTPPSPRLDSNSSSFPHHSSSSKSPSFQPLSSHPSSFQPTAAHSPSSNSSSPNRSSISSSSINSSRPLYSPHHATSADTRSNHVTIASINCLYTNAISLNSVNKRADLVLRCTAGFDIILVTETWYNDTSIVSLSSYKAFRRDRGSHGGGVIIYIRDTLFSSEINDNELRRTLCPSTGNVEQVWCEVSTHQGGDKYLLGCIYRPPLNARTSDEKAKHANIASDINKSIAVAARAVNSGMHKGVCIAGDFNFPDLRWSDDSVTNRGKHDGLAGAFLDTLDDLSLHQACVFQRSSRRTAPRRTFSI